MSVRVKIHLSFGSEFYFKILIYSSIHMCVQKYVYGSQRLETTYMPVRREGMGQFWDIRTMQYSATIEAKGKSNCVGLP